MADFLVLRLRGPLMNFGAVAVDEIRPTHRLPTLSMLTGLLANSLGWRHKEGERLGRLQERLVFGARLDRPGEPLEDYQNAQINEKQCMWRTRSEAPLCRSGQKYDNIQRWRHYLADASVTVVLTLLPVEEEPTLDQVSEALHHPARPLFLGRVSCPPSGYIHFHERVIASSIPAALERAADLEAAGGVRQAEWGAHGSLTGDDGLARRIVERTDIRNWEDDLHQGRRLVVCGSIMTNTGGER
jgi:CRISPR system Cascade subunit CasD